MYNRCKSSESQIKYIKNLMTSKASYILMVDLVNLSKGEASNLIQSLLYDTNEKLITEKTLKLMPDPITKEDFAKIIKEDKNNKLSSTEQCFKVSYKVLGSLHIWGWTDFKEEINGRVIAYDTTGNIINSITYEVEKEIDKRVLKKYGLIAQKIK